MVDKNNNRVQTTEDFYANTIVYEGRTGDKDFCDKLAEVRCTTDVLDKHLAKKVSCDVKEGNNVQNHHAERQRQSTDGVYSFGSEANSTLVSSVTGYPLECELPRSQC